MTPRPPYDVTVVTAVPASAQEVPPLLASLTAQRGLDLSRVEVVLVVLPDGGGSAIGVLEAWGEQVPCTVSVLTLLDGGRAEARTLGLRHARAEWVTLPDPDDVLDPDCAARLLAFAAENPQVEMLAAHRLVLDAATGRAGDTHPLRQMFAGGDVLVDLDRFPEYLHDHAGSAWFRRVWVVTGGLAFDPRLGPAFEDTHFCVRYLLGCPRPEVGFVASAHYLQRRDTLLAARNGFTDPHRWTTVPRVGYLDLLAEAVERRGDAPEWVQNVVLHELSRLFGADAAHGVPTAAHGGVGAEFVQILRDVARRLDPLVVASFGGRALDPAWRQILLHGFTAEEWHSTYAVLDRVDDEQDLARVTVRWAGPEPRIEYLSGGVPTAPVHTKVRSHVLFGYALLHERLAWLPASAPVRVVVDGRVAEIRDHWAGPATTTYDVLDTSGPVAAPGPATSGAPADRLALTLSGARRTVTALARPRPVADAWVLMDRVADADDNAERLFEYLRENRPDVNAWFTVRAGTPDWERLSAGRHADRVVAHGSPAWERLMLSCRHLVSSHADAAVHRPPQVMALLGDRPPPWRFTFLQHGVLTSDLSGWLDAKAVDLLVVSTPDEYAMVAGDGTPYAYCSKEVRLTGLPRFDRLRRIARSLAPEERDLVLVAPTWRQWLRRPGPDGGEPVVVDDLAGSEWARRWTQFLASPVLAAAAREHGLRIGFLPHPHLQTALERLDLPDHVQPLSFTGGVAQRLFASAAVLVTDWSSSAFNAAYVDRPVVYFQFDAERVLSGGHLGRAGGYDYERDGFGPVTRTVEDAVAATVEVVGRGGILAPEYARRVERAFPDRDGRCCERVVAAVEALDHPCAATAAQASATAR